MVRVLCYVVRGLGGAKEKTERAPRYGSEASKESLIF